MMTPTAVRHHYKIQRLDNLGNLHALAKQDSHVSEFSDDLFWREPLLDYDLSLPEIVKSSPYLWTRFRGTSKLGQLLLSHWTKFREQRHPRPNTRSGAISGGTPRGPLLGPPQYSRGMLGQMQCLAFGHRPDARAYSASISFTVTRRFFSLGVAGSRIGPRPMKYIRGCSTPCFTRNRRTVSTLR